MANFKTFVIYNKGSETVTFQFSEFSIKFEEKKERNALIGNINENETNERYFKNVVIPIILTKSLLKLLSCISLGIN